MKIKKEDVGYVALLACILNGEPIMKEDVIPSKRRLNSSKRRKVEIDNDLMEFIGRVQFI